MVTDDNPAFYLSLIPVATDDEIEAYDERVAIMIHDGGMSVREAELAAIADLKRKRKRG